MSAGREDAPPALHGREFTLKTEDGTLVVVGAEGTRIEFQDAEGNQMGISPADVPYDQHNHSESGMASAVAGGVAASSIGTGDLTDRAVTSRKVAGSAVQGSGIAPSAVSAGRLADRAVTSRAIAGSAVVASAIADSAVAAAKLADSAVGARELDQSDAYDFTGGVSISGADVEERYFSSPVAQGDVLSGNATIVYQTHISANETMAVTQAGLTADDGSPVDSGVALGIARLDGAGGGAWKATAITGDGATVFDSRQGDPLASYTPTSAGQVAVMIDNGNFAGAPGGASVVSSATWGAAIGRVS